LFTELAKIVVAVVVVAGAAEEAVLGTFDFGTQFFVYFFRVAQLVETLFTRWFFLFSVISAPVFVLVFVITFDVGLIVIIFVLVVGLVLVDIIAFLFFLI
jgi:hypothetical protein